MQSPQSGGKTKTARGDEQHPTAVEAQHGGGGIICGPHRSSNAPRRPPRPEGTSTSGAPGAVQGWSPSRRLSAIIAVSGTRYGIIAHRNEGSASACAPLSPPGEGRRKDAKVRAGCKRLSRPDTSTPRQLSISTIRSAICEKCLGEIFQRFPLRH